MLTFSYTEMARRHAPAFLAGPEDVSPMDMDAVQFDKWLTSLPRNVQGEVRDGIQKIAQGLPPLLQVALAKTTIQNGYSLPFSLPLEGLGCACDPGASGLGQYEAFGAIAGALLKTGGEIYSSKLSNDMQKSLANNAAKQDANIAKAQADAAVKTQKLLADAQVKAAQALAKSSVQKAQAHAPIIIAGISVVALAGFGAFLLYLKRKNRKT